MAKLEVICGPMFAGKTEELIRRVKRCVLATQAVQVFKPSMDYRFGVDRITSHGKTDLEVATGIRPMAVKDGERLQIHDDTSVVAFDEAQFFDEKWLLPIIESLVNDAGIRVICAGLDMNTYGEPFGCMPSLLAKADEVMKVKAVCTECGNDATRTYRDTPYTGEKAVEIGGMGLYKPRCLVCWEPTPR
jgi:thymidine kinase